MSICVQHDVTRHLICLFWLVPSDVTQHQLLSYALHFKFIIPDWHTLLHDFGIFDITKIENILQKLSRLGFYFSKTKHQNQIWSQELQLVMGIKVEHLNVE